MGKQHEIAIWGERRSGNVPDRIKDVRNPYERDRSRVIHSASFRRLQGKTQVLGIAEGDFHRTRLTHSMEVAQIGRGIVEYLNRRLPKKLDEELKLFLTTTSLIETVCFCHDLGHPPFGHSGETALNYMMRNHGGFEGNGQTLRILSYLESYTPHYGLDLTRRALLGVLKYPASYNNVHKKDSVKEVKSFRNLVTDEAKPPKCFHEEEKPVVDWILQHFTNEEQLLFATTNPEKPSDSAHAKTIYKSFDTSILNLADDIAYGVHDLEDGIALNLVNVKHWKEIEKYYDASWGNKIGLGEFKELTDELFNKSSSNRKKAIGAIVHALITSVEVIKIKGFDSPLLKYNVEFKSPAKTLLHALMNLTVKHIIKIQPVQTLEYRGRFMVMCIFEAIASNPAKLLNKSFAQQYEEANNENEKMRVVCDYVAGMTDSYAARMYQRLFIPGQGTIFEKL